MASISIPANQLTLQELVDLVLAKVLAAANPPITQEFDRRK